MESAARVAVNGLEKHPALAAGHDLYARILTDMGDFEAAEEEWQQALDAEPRHTGAMRSATSRRCARPTSGSGFLMWIS